MDIHTIVTWLSSALAIWLGSLIKKSNASNRWIPWLVLGVAFLNQVLQAAGAVGTAGAQALADSVAAAPVHHGFFSVLLAILLKSLVQAGLTIGGFESVKSGVLGRVSESRKFFGN